MSRFLGRPETGQPIPLWADGAPLLQPGDEGNQPVITPWFPNGDGSVPAVLVLPGGGYRMRAPHEGRPVAEWLNGLGIGAFVVDYRVFPYQHPVPLMDAQRALRMVRYHAEEWGISPDKIGILGFSAGGHLASSTATHFDDGLPLSDDPIDLVHCRPDLAILCYPVISMTAYPHSGSRVNLLGDDPLPELTHLMSSELHVTPRTPPVFLWHTADDEAVPVENSLMFAEALSRNGVSFEIHVYQTGRHGLGLAPDEPHVGQWTAACAAWLKQRGF